MNMALMKTVIRYIHKKGFELNSGSIQKHTSQITKAVKERYGVGASSMTLARYSKELFDGWDNALYASGFNPVVIKRRGYTLALRKHELETQLVLTKEVYQLETDSLIEKLQQEQKMITSFIKSIK